MLYLCRKITYDVDLDLGPKQIITLNNYRMVRNLTAVVLRVKKYRSILQGSYTSCVELLVLTAILGRTHFQIMVFSVNEPWAYKRRWNSLTVLLSNCVPSLNSQLFLYCSWSGHFNGLIQSTRDPMLLKSSKYSFAFYICISCRWSGYFFIALGVQPSLCYISMKCSYS